MTVILLNEAVKKHFDSEDNSWNGKCTCKN